MEVRDAVEADAPDLAAIVDTPADVMRNVVHDRTVRVAVRQSDDGPNVDVTSADDADTGDEGGNESERESVLGFVSFDAREDTVYVTQFGGTTEACERLIGEPVRFATNERMNVELIVEASDDVLASIAESAGFNAAGPGPSFGGRETTKYRRDVG